jgi:hypothetical protein
MYSPINYLKFVVFFGSVTPVTVDIVNLLSGIEVCVRRIRILLFFGVFKVLVEAVI